MNSSSSPNGSSAYLESLMRAGQQSMKQFDDALASAMGVEGKPPTRELIAVCRHGKLATAVLVSGHGLLERLPRRRICSGFPAVGAAKGASRTRPGSTRLTTNLSRSPT